MRRRALPAIAANLAGIVALAGALPAQRIVSSVDLSGTSVWYADSIHSAGSSINPALRVDWTRATLSAFGSVSQLERGNLSMEGTLAPSVFTPSIGPFTAEFAGSLGGSTHQDGTKTGQTLGLVRAYAMGDAAGAWAGAGAGRTWDGSVWRSVRQAEAGAWIETGGVTTLATVSPVVVADTIRYTDTQLALRYPVNAFELGLTAGTRSGSVGAADGGTSRTWGSVSVIAWLTSRLALVGNVGTYPVDLTQGYAGGRFATVALRIASRNARSADRTTTQTSSPRSDSAPDTSGALASGPGATVFDTRTVNGTSRLLRVYAPAAHTVEINADFTLWQAVQLARGGDGWWAITRPIAAGTYQMNLRIDGGPWLAPPGLLTTNDEFGGTVGLLTIE